MNGFRDASSIGGLWLGITRTFGDRPNRLQIKGRGYFGPTGDYHRSARKRTEYVALTSVPSKNIRRSSVPMFIG